MLLGVHVFESAWAALLSLHALALVMIGASGRWTLAFGGYRRAGGAAALRLAIAGVVAALVAAALMRLLSHWYAGPAGMLPPRLAELGIGGGAFTLFALYHAFLNPWIEEAYWRGAFGEPDGVLRASDFAFAAYHTLVLGYFTTAGPIVLSGAALVIAGAFWRYTLRRTGSLWPATLAHVSADAAIMLVVSRWVR